MLWKMPDLSPYLFLLSTVIIILMTNDVTAESDMMTLEEYRDFITKQALKNKNGRPKKVWNVSERSLYDDLGEARVDEDVKRRTDDAEEREEGVERWKGDVEGREEDAKRRKEDEADWERSRMLIELKRFHRDGEPTKSRYRRSLDQKPTTEDEITEDDNNNNSDKSRHLGVEGRHFGVEDRKYLPESGQIHVISSAIRVLPNEEKRGGQKRTARIMNFGVERKENGTGQEQNGKAEDEGHRQKRNEYHWRRPKTQFVTGTYRMTPPSSRFQLPAFPASASQQQQQQQLLAPRNNRRYLSDNEVSPAAAFRRSGGSSQRRIIYYATLPEIVRPPTANLWQRHQSLTGLTAHAPPPPQPHPPPLHQPSTRQAQPLSPPPNTNPNPPPADNEIIHVSSAVIDVTNNRDQPSLPSSQQPPAILATSAITAIPNSGTRNTIYDITPTNQNGGSINKIYDITSTNPTQNGGSKYTIYDMEPPYMRQPYYNNYYNLDNKLSGYDKQRYSYYYQNYQPFGQYPPPVHHQNRFYEDVRTPPYRVHTPYHSDLPPYQNSVGPYQNSVGPYQNSVGPYQNAGVPYQNGGVPYQPFYNRKPEYVPIEIQTTAPSVSSTESSTTTTTTEATKGVGDPRHQTSSGGELKQDKGGNSTNGLVSRYV
ncbi:hypothetical protein LSTR_LSTR011354 [Laodelphax striatellus]|uniref:Uncharacterized protein n=1 Tax=Laodelphax striatellus TaxID=195883 RepID=A0A482XIK3_LAOST|nr:hypothetical protein LSTR_LSTR011354 [Laodelphax striatellus]